MHRERKSWEKFLTVFPHISGAKATGGKEAERNSERKGGKMKRRGSGG